MIKIGDFSKLARISIRMLRYYDSIGLLKPSSLDVFTGYRYYDVSQLTEAFKINALREMGFGLAEIEKILEEYKNPLALAAFLEGKQAEVQIQRKMLDDRLVLISTSIERLRKDEKSMNYSVTVKTFPKRYAACVRKTIKNYYDEGELWKLLKEEAGELQTEAPFCAMAFFRDNCYKENDVDVEIQMSVKGNYKDTEHVKFREVPEILAASAVYKGPYELITEAYEAIMDYISGNGYEIDGSMFNIYHVSPSATNNPEEYVTEVCIPVKKA